ncbi:PP2C family protein-serine/threonine phosphatase [Actinacidiphila sp. ITFR-21]|uniref:PP2C family protein-serine/threonine phosphatase n=1 Tax=Actinacidiphila sp. ITFR-21 TaxID=3075199 RepID=UPI00288A7DB3|nr:PP2C family protein-serine/threonine phosphatase [Streptomyces sp. ITFR-21]WNI16538.1 PP2C family protein-serine/threonine phosphatase [Streptomyces sp. ITFR-21]
MSPAHVRKVAGSERTSSGTAQNAAVPVSAATAPAPPAAPPPGGARPVVLPARGAPDHALAVQDRLAAWVCDLSLVHELTERLAATSTLADTLREVLAAGATLVGASRGLVALEPADGAGPDLTVGLGLAHGDLGALETVGHPPASGGPGTDPGADPGETLLPDLRHDPALAPRHREVAAQLGLGAGYALGLTTTGRHRLGTAVWFYDEPAEPTERQRRLTGLYLRFAAEHIARCLDLRRAQGAAASLTAELLPARLPRVPGVRMAVRHRTGPRGGGDWYDALPLPEGALGLAVGGVTGSGPGAVAAMGRLRASLRAYAVMEGEDPVAVLSDLELLMRLTEPARSATALFGYVTAAPDRGRKVVLAGAGHCPPLLVGDHRCAYAETTLSAPLNMLGCWEAPSVELSARPGESLLLYTDGLLRRTGEPVDRAFAHLHAAAQSAPRAVREDPERLADHVLHALLPDGLDRADGVEDLVLLVTRFE